jgi:hypothetical protein
LLKKEAPDHQHKTLYQLRKVTRLFALIVIALLVVGYFLPRTYHIERSLDLDVERGDVANFLADGSKLTTWLYVQKGKVEIIDKALSQGLVFEILYDSGKKGSIQIGELSPTAFRFTVIPKSGQRSVSNEIEFETLSEGNKTRVSWSIDGELDAGLLSPYLAIFANDIAGANFEKSLSLMKGELE